MDDLEALKAKNIKQTELVADLREAILRVARHFQCTDPKNCSVVSHRFPVLCPEARLGDSTFLPHPEGFPLGQGPSCCSRRS